MKNLPVAVADSAFRVGRATIALTVQAPPPPFVEIHDIQGPGTASPFANQAVTTRGIVTAVRFFDTTNDPGTSDAVLTATAFANRLNKVSLEIRDVMRSPDIVGVEEMENLATLQDTTYIDPNTGTPAILNDRPPLVLRAIVGGPDDVPAPVTVIVNHLRSLSGVDDPVDGNRVRVKRAAQAEVELAPADQRYSFSFDGAAQELDHVIVTRNVLPSFLGVNSGRTNADFPESFRNDPSRPERLSDHDPVVTYYRLKAVTTTTAFEAPNPAGLGAIVTLTATVTSPGGTVSDGVVTFFEGATALGTAPVVGGTATLGLTTFGLGAHTVTASYGGADLFGASASGGAAFTVADLELPVVAGVTVHPGSIWPPNDKLTRVRVTPSVTDDVDVQPSCAITGISAYDSDHDRRHGRHEPQRPGHAEEDSRITGALTAELRAERGNIYSITVACTDAAGNAATSQATVAVRHDRDHDRDGRDDSDDRDRR